MRPGEEKLPGRIAQDKNLHVARYSIRFGDNPLISNSLNQTYSSVCKKKLFPLAKFTSVL
ncbi:hypothetical protein X963_4762 [Burkholderia pseudomallei MSHR7498]|nr:hypothetical protein GBP346_B3371 [Burkholderia pseudomallei MSHR346]KGS93149.1 hypothetical protein X963_4762 [Burkholderia pseudomallei MSHR7498]